MAEDKETRSPEQTTETNHSVSPARMPLRDGRSATPGASASSEKLPDERGGKTPDVKHTSTDTNAG